jgi:MFS family permease
MPVQSRSPSPPRQGTRVPPWWHPARLTDGLPAWPVTVVGLSMLVRNVDTSLFTLLSPEIKATFHLGLTGITTLAAITLPLSFLLDPVAAYFADRWPRTTILALAWSVFAVFTAVTGFAGLVVGLGLMYVARLGSATATLFNSTQLSLLSDYYPPTTRAKIFMIRPLTDIGGHLIGPLAAGLVAAGLGWQWPFLVMAVPTLAVGLLLGRLREPSRGYFERRATGQDDDQARTPEKPPGFLEALTTLMGRPATRRFYLAFPFLATAAIGVANLVQLFYSQVFQVDVAERGLITAIAEPCQLAGILAGATYFRRVMRQEPARAVRLTAVAGVGLALSLLGFTVAPTLAIAIVLQAIMTAFTALTAPGLFVMMSALVPPRMRTMGFAVSSLWLVPGALTLPLAGAIGDHYGIRAALAVLVPITLLGCLILASASVPLRRETTARSDTDGPEHAS